MKGKTCVWLVWLFTTVLSAGYGAMSLFVFITLTKMKSRGYRATEGAANRYGIFAATILSFASVAFYVVFTLLVLLRKSFHAKAATGYGIILASAGNTAMLLLLSSLVLHGAKPRAEFWKKQKWFTTNDYFAYLGTFAVGYILTFFYAMNCLILLFFKPAMDYEAPPPAAVPTASQSINSLPQSVEIPSKMESIKIHDDDVVEEVADVVAKPKGFFGAWSKK